jgi:hypothetical protein
MNLKENREMNDITHVILWIIAIIVGLGYLFINKIIIN